MTKPSLQFEVLVGLLGEQKATELCAMWGGYRLPSAQQVLRRRKELGMRAAWEKGATPYMLHMRFVVPMPQVGKLIAKWKAEKSQGQTKPEPPPKVSPL
jgi:hypothetical protein